MKENPKGKILRVKLGYNPNSSSMGSIVFAIPTMLLVVSTIFGTATTTIFSHYLKEESDDKCEEEETASEESIV